MFVHEVLLSCNQCGSLGLLSSGHGTSDETEAHEREVGRQRQSRRGSLQLKEKKTVGSVRRRTLQPYKEKAGTRSESTNSFPSECSRFPKWWSASGKILERLWIISFLPWTIMTSGWIVEYNFMALVLRPQKGLRVGDQCNLNMTTKSMIIQNIEKFLGVLSFTLYCKFP